MLEYLNQYSGSLNVINTFLLVLITIIYAVITYNLFLEAKKMREFQNEPRIVVNLRPREEFLNWIDLVMQNVGLGPAYDVKFNIKPDFEYSKGNLLSKVGFFQKGIYCLPANDKISFYLTSMLENFDKKIKTSFDIEINYRDIYNKRYNTIVPIDFSVFINVTQLGKPPLHRVAENINKPQEDINKISRGWNKIKVITYTKEEIEKEKEEMLKEAKQIFEQNDQDKN